MRIYKCDVCGHDPASITVRSKDHGEVELCSVSCLQDWAIDAAVEDYLVTSHLT